MKNLLCFILLFICTTVYGQRIQYIGDSYFTSPIYIKTLNAEIHPTAKNVIAKIGARVTNYTNQATYNKIRIFNPDVVIVSLGTNSSYYSYNKIQHTQQLNQFIRNLKYAVHRNCKIIFITPFQNRRAGQPNIYAKQCADNIANICISQNCYVINTYNMFGNILYTQHMLARDNVHLTSRGYEYIGHTIGKTIHDIVK